LTFVVARGVTAIENLQRPIAIPRTFVFDTEHFFFDALATVRTTVAPLGILTFAYLLIFAKEIVLPFLTVGIAALDTVVGRIARFDTADTLEIPPAFCATAINV
jgi:hypothetical protein